MGKDAFDAAMSALWRELGLAPPRPRADARASLTVDGRTVTLTLGDDERSIVAAAEIDAVSSDPVESTDQMRRMLRDGCGLVLDRRAALRLRPGRGSGSGVRAIAEVQAVTACDPRDPRPLVRAIEDVLFLVDVHAPTLVSGRAGRGAPALGAADLDGALIFRL